MNKTLILVALYILFLFSGSDGFHNKPNFDETTTNPTDQRSYNRADANKPVSGGGYYGGHDTITAEGIELKKNVHDDDPRFHEWANGMTSPLRVGAHDEDSTRVTSSDNSVPFIEWRFTDPPIGSTGWGGFFSHFFNENGDGLKGRGTPAPERAEDYLKEIEKIAGCTPGGTLYKGTGTATGSTPRPTAADNGRVLQEIILSLTQKSSIHKIASTCLKSMHFFGGKKQWE